MLSVLPLLLKSVFSGFRMVQESVYPAPVITKNDEKIEEAPQRSILGYLGTFFSRKPVKQIDDLNNVPKLQ